MLHQLSLALATFGGNMRSRDYLIIVVGEFGDLLTSAFSDLSIDVIHGQTLLRLEHADQSRLHGVLDRLLGFGIEITSFRELGPSVRGRKESSIGSG